MSGLTIVADENMPRVREWFAPLGEVRVLPGRTLSAADVRDADVLLVRSVTRVDRALLDGSRVQFVGTATIGTDHLDLDWLRAAGIAVASAPGCNAESVVEYILSALAVTGDLLESLLGRRRHVGIVGLGNVGGRLACRLSALGIDVIGCDPLVAGSVVPSRSLDEVLAADVVCLHTPLTRGGDHPTWHLLDAARIAALRPGTLLLNAGRGGVIDTAALLQRLRRSADLDVVLDVWEGEPAISVDLLERVRLGTPHIAGYSLDGKLAGTRRVLEACCRHFGLPLPELDDAGAPPRLLLDAALDEVALLRSAVLQACDIRTDDARMRAALRDDAGGAAFDALRRHYPVRRELAAFEVELGGELSVRQWQLLSAAGVRATR